VLKAPLAPEALQQAGLAAMGRGYTCSISKASLTRNTQSMAIDAGIRVNGLLFALSEVVGAVSVFPPALTMQWSPTRHAAPL